MSMDAQYAVIPGKAKPSKSASTDGTRPVLQHAELRQDRDGVWELVTSDSYQMARVKLDVRGDGEAPTPGPISPDALKAIEKTRAFRANGTVEPCDTNGCPTGMSFARPDIGTFPAWDQLTPEPPADDDCYVIGLDAKLLYALAQSIDTPGGRNSHVFLRLNLAPFREGGARCQMRAMPVSRDGRNFDGLLMPVRPNV